MAIAEASTVSPAEHGHALVRLRSPSQAAWHQTLLKSSGTRPCYPRRWRRGECSLPTSPAWHIVMVQFVPIAGQECLTPPFAFSKGWATQASKPPDSASRREKTCPRDGGVGMPPEPDAKRRVEPALRARRGEIEHRHHRSRHCQLRRQWHTPPEPSSCPPGPTKDPGHPRSSSRPPLKGRATHPGTGWGTRAPERVKSVLPHPLPAQRMVHPQRTADRSVEDHRVPQVQKKDVGHPHPSFQQWTGRWQRGRRSLR